MENPMERENLEEIVSNCFFFSLHCWSFVQVPAGSVKSLAEVAAGLNLQVNDCDWIQYLISMIWLSLVAFQLWRVLEQLAPDIFLNYFFKRGDLSMVQTSGHGDPCDKWVNNILTPPQATRWTFWRVWDFSITANMFGLYGKSQKSKVI